MGSCDRSIVTSAPSSRATLPPFWNERDYRTPVKRPPTKCRTKVKQNDFYSIVIFLMSLPKWPVLNNTNIINIHTIITIYLLTYLFIRLFCFPEEHKVSDEHKWRLEKIPFGTSFIM